MKKLFSPLLVVLLLSMALLLPMAAAAGMLPNMAAEMADELDAQLAQRFGISKRPLQNISLIMTTPVSLGNFEATSPMARLVAEEMSTWFVSAGYNVKEIRRGQNILFAPNRGEFLMTRKARLLQRKNMGTELIVTGTYTVTSKTRPFQHPRSSCGHQRYPGHVQRHSAHGRRGMGTRQRRRRPQYSGHQTQCVHKPEQRNALLTRSCGQGETPCARYCPFCSSASC